MGLGQLNFAGHNKVDVALMRLREFEPPDGFYLADSFGKDSSVILDLAKRAGVQFDAHYSMPGIDPPELVKFGREFHPGTICHRPPESIFKAIVRKGMPFRQGRWCCELLKEKAGSGRLVLTGIRWAESSRRKKRLMFEVSRNDRSKSYLHPIIDWSAAEVWEYIHLNEVPYCCLYDEGFKRLGCVLCPMGTPRITQLELLRFPKLAEAWKRACYRLYDRRVAAGAESVKRFPTAEHLWQWWLTRKGQKAPDGTCQAMFV